MVFLTLGLIAILFFAPFLGWALALYLVYKTYISTRLSAFDKIFSYIVLAIVSILPAHSVFVYPLIALECNSHGGIETFENNQAIPKDIVIDGYFYNLNDRYPVSELLLNGTVNSIYYSSNSRFGEGSDIKSAAENYDGSPFTLKSSGTTDVACGPFYSYIGNEEVEYQSARSIEKCIAYSQGGPSENHLRLRKTINTESSFRTLWHNVEWTKITYEIVSKNVVNKIYEIREFDYKGLAYPVFVNWFRVASYSCKANTDAYISLKKILHLDTQSHLMQKTSMPDSKARLASLINTYFGFEFPQEVMKYDISVHDIDNFSSQVNPLKINIHIPKSETPVLLELYTNEFANWNIKPSENQVIVTLRSRNSTDNVLSVNTIPVIDIQTEALKENPLLKFYSSYFTRLHFKATGSDKYCAVQVRPNNIETDVDLSVCLNNNDIKLNIPNR